MEQNNKKTWLIVAVLAVLVIVLAVLMSNRQETAPVEEELPQYQAPISLFEGDYVNEDTEVFDTYLRENISEISPQKEVLGGTFYVTNMEWLDVNEAIVNYEDGHIALMANVVFSYADAEGTIPQVQSFTFMPLDEELEVEEIIEDEVVEEVIEEPVIEEEIVEEVVEEVEEEVTE